MASACPKCNYFPVRCRCAEILLEAENKKLRKALERIMNEKGDYWYDKMIKVAKEALEK